MSSTPERPEIVFEKVEGASPRYVSRYVVRLAQPHDTFLGQVEQRKHRPRGSSRYVLGWFARPPEQREIGAAESAHGEPRPFRTRGAAAEALRDLHSRQPSTDQESPDVGDAR